MTHTSAMSEARSKARSSGSPYAVVKSGAAFRVRAKKGFFEKLPKGSCTVYPSGKVFPPSKGGRVARKRRNPELLVVRNNPKKQAVLTDRPEMIASSLKLEGKRVNKRTIQRRLAKARKLGKREVTISGTRFVWNPRRRSNMRIRVKHKRRRRRNPTVAANPRRRRKARRRNCRVALNKRRTIRRKRRRNMPLKKRYGSKYYTRKGFVRKYSGKFGSKKKAGSKWKRLRKAKHGKTKFRKVAKKRRGRKKTRRNAASTRRRFRVRRRRR